MSRQVNTTSSGSSFAEKLNEALAGTTSESFARRIDRTLRTVQRWRSGATEPSGSDLVLIARTLGRDPSWFYEPHNPEEAAA
jgi:transcriptional regulator with XRE-family HTH domain